MLTYDTAVSICSKARDGRKRLELNTYAEMVPDEVRITLHNTIIIKIVHGDVYTLNSGGWRTPTTKDRLNKYSPSIVYCKNGVWYCGPRGMRHDCEAIPFFDGMTVNVNGYCQNAPPKSEIVANLANKRRLDKLAREYIKGYAESAVSAGKLEQPGNGDCWGCLFKAENKAPEKRKGSGWAIGGGFDVKASNPLGVDHILSHFEEKYYVPSLLVKAIVARGYKDPGFIWGMIDGYISRGESRMLVDVLRSYFKRIKPALLEAMPTSKKAKGA